MFGAAGIGSLELYQMIHDPAAKGGIKAIPIFRKYGKKADLTNRWIWASAPIQPTDKW